MEMDELAEQMRSEQEHQQSEAKVDALITQVQVLSKQDAELQSQMKLLMRTIEDLMNQQSKIAKQLEQVSTSNSNA